MPYYAQITNGTVTAVTESHSAISAPDMVEVPSYDISLLGHSYANGVFTAPVIAQTHTTDALGFYRRFTSQERIAIRALAKTDPLVEDFMALLDLAVAKGGNIDLLDTDTINGVNYIQTAVPLAAGRSSALLA